MRYIGVDIGGTKCSIVLGDDNLKVLKKAYFLTSDFDTTFKRIIEEIKNMGEFDAIGISCGGPLNSEKGIIMSPPNLPDWDNVNITDILKKEFNVPVALCHDADACALAEWKFGAGKGTKNMIFITFGTGCGAGLILDGKLYKGTCNTAGEVGHIRLSDDGPFGFEKYGSFEGFCSGAGLARQGESIAKEKQVKFYDENGKITAKSIAEAAKKGDADAIEIFNQSGKMLGKGLAILVDTLNPERIVIGSIYQRCEDLLIPEMKKEFEKECLIHSRQVCEIVPAKLGDDIGDVAALNVAYMEKHKDSLYNRYPALSECSLSIEKAKDMIIETYKNGGKVLVCGNGGSASDSEHIVGELMKGFMLQRPVTDERIPEDLRTRLQGSLPAISLPSQSGILSAFCNDVDPDMIYAQLVYGYAKENDLLIAITTSGNSKNVVNAGAVAKALGTKVVALIGKNDGKISEFSDVTINVPETETYKVQEYHLPVYHYLCEETEKYFFERNK